MSFEDNIQTLGKVVESLSDDYYQRRFAAEELLTSWVAAKCAMALNGNVPLKTFERIIHNAKVFANRLDLVWTDESFVPGFVLDRLRGDDVEGESDGDIN